MMPSKRRWLFAGWVLLAVGTLVACALGAPQSIVMALLVLETVAGTLGALVLLRLPPLRVSRGWRVAEEEARRKLAEAYRRIGQLATGNPLDDQVPTAEDFAAWIDKIDGMLTNLEPLASDVGTGIQDMLLSNMLKLRFLRLFILNAIEKAEKAVNELLDQFTAALEENNQTSELNDKTLASQEQEVGSVHVLMDKSHQIVSSLDNGMAQLFSAYQKIDVEMGKVAKSVESIGGIMQKIVEIADYNDVIAINASIEAARLGADGKGFRVLVLEVRKANASVRQFITEIGSIVATLSEQNADFLSVWRSVATETVTSLTETKDYAEVVINSLVKAFEARNQIILRERSTAGATKNKLYALLGSLQFQDLTRQQLENVILHMGSIEETFMKHKDSFSYLGWNVDLDRAEINEDVLAELKKTAKLPEERELIRALSATGGEQ
jgi:hypothetical protein